MPRKKDISKNKTKNKATRTTKRKKAKTSTLFDSIEERNIKNFPKAKEIVKKSMDSDKFFGPFKKIIPLWSEFEQAVWEDILADLLIIYSWRVPSNMAVKGMLLPLLENVFFSFLTIFYSNVLGITLNLSEITEKENNKNKKSLSYKPGEKIKEEDIN